MGCNYNYNCCNCHCYKECDDEHKQVVVEAMTKEDMLTFWDILKQKFAWFHHSHDMQDVDTGVLPVERGGTGAENAEDAVANLGAAPENHTHDFGEIDFTSEDVLAEEHGGTGMTQSPKARVDLSSVDEDDVFKEHSEPGVKGVLGVENGGTGRNNISDFRNDLNIPGEWDEDAQKYVLSIANGGTGISAEDVDDIREEIGAAPEEHTHDADDINNGILGIAHGGTGGGDASSARQSLGAAAVDHTHYTMGTAKQHYESNPNTYNQTINENGYVFFNEYIAAAVNTKLKRDPTTGSTFNGIKVPANGNYLFAGHINCRPSIEGIITVAIVRTNSQGAEDRIARSMQKCYENEANTIAIPLQYVNNIQANDVIRLYVSGTTGCTIDLSSQNAASLTAMYIASGIMVD